MTQSSVGSGANTDSNENHPKGGLPAKTMGEDLQTSSTSSAQTSPTQDGQAPEQVQEEATSGTTENELTSTEEVLPSLPTGTAEANPENFSDGPNVGPSPWEKDAAQGKG